MVTMAYNYMTLSQLLDALNIIANMAKEIAEYELEQDPYSSSYSDDYVSDLKHYLYEKVMTQLCGEDYFDKVNNMNR